MFHCQQAAEKALKAFLTFHDQPFRKTHDLASLGKQYANIDATLEALVDRLDDLSEYAWAYRYRPDSPSLLRGTLRRRVERLKRRSRRSFADCRKRCKRPWVPTGPAAMLPDRISHIERRTNADFLHVQSAKRHTSGPVGRNRDQIVNGGGRSNDLYRLAHVQDADLPSGPDYGRAGELTAEYRRDDTAAKETDCDADEGPGSVDELVADFEFSTRHQLLTKLQSHTQQYHGERSPEGARPAFDGQQCQQGQPGVGASAAPWR